MAIKEAERIQAVYAEGMRLMQSGDGEAALRKFAQVLNENPKIAEAHFQIARLFLGVDRLEPALHHAQQAVRLRPKVMDVWRLLSEIVMVLSDVDQRDIFRSAVDRSPLERGEKAALKTSVDFAGRTGPYQGDLPANVVETFLPKLEASQFAAAEQILRDVVGRYPKSAMAQNGLAVALLGTGKAQEALPVSEKAVRLDPSYTEARLNLARVLVALRRAPEGIHQCNLALRSVPGSVPALLCRVECNKALRRIPEVQADLKRALKLDRKNERANRMLLSVLVEAADYFAAEDLIERTWTPKNMPFAVAMHRAKILAETERTEEALAAYTEISRTFDEETDLAFKIADLNQSLGNFSAAEEHFEAAMADNPDRGEVFRLYLTSKKIPLDDPLVSHMEEKFNDPSVEAQSRAQFGFALGKVYEDQKAYDRVFDYIHPANALQKSTYNYKVEKRLALDRRILGAMQRVDWSNATVRTENTQTPIFVTGMPRSGTTLVEQIISSHSRVAGAGEVQRITRMAVELLGGEEMPMRPPSEIPPAALDAFADNYWGHLRRLQPDAEFITDKTIQTYMFGGLLKMAMPKCRIIVVKRDPRDNLLSMYKNVFPDGSHLYAYDLKWLAEVYRSSEEFLAYWREVRPDWIYEIQYEDLVANPEEETRKLIEACGLEWEDACLNFHENERRVNTLSLYQVRQPMYKSSTRAWERYGDALDELFEALGPEYAPAAE